jgi:ABC-type multidrug transport system fused ATPase/permease subunit
VIFSKLYNLYCNFFKGFVGIEMINQLATFQQTLQNLKRDNRGFIDKIIMVGIAVMVLVAVLIALAYFSAAVPTIDDPVANETITKTFSLGYQSMSILGIAVLISAVVTIIVVIMGAFGYGFSTGGGRR